jgi:hypothetical protein
MEFNNFTVKKGSMQRRSTILIVAGVTISAIISGVASYTHFRLLATEGEEHGNETPEQIAQEVLTGQPAHPVQNNTADANNTNDSRSIVVDPESLETPEQRAAEGH